MKVSTLKHSMAIRAAMIVGILLCIGRYAYALSNSPDIIVSGESMSPTLQDGDRISGQRVTSVDDLTYGVYAIQVPPSLMSVDKILDIDRSKPLLVKRIIGLPEDHIICVDGKLMRNGSPVNLPSYYSALNFDYILAADEVFLIGDNLTESYDSRHFGPIKIDDTSRIYKCDIEDKNK